MALPIETKAYIARAVPRMAWTIKLTDDEHVNLPIPKLCILSPLLKPRLAAFRSTMPHSKWPTDASRLFESRKRLKRCKQRPNLPLAANMHKADDASPAPKLGAKRHEIAHANAIPIIVKRSQLWTHEGAGVVYLDAYKVVRALVGRGREKTRDARAANGCL